MDHIQTSYMAKQFNMDRSHLYRISKEKVGLSIKDYIQQVHTRGSK